MKGNRNDISPHLYKRGDYGKWEGYWYCMPPWQYAECYIGCLGDGVHNHQVIEHEDGTISVSPSILINVPHLMSIWHGYLERGVWREC